MLSAVTTLIGSAQAAKVLGIDRSVFLRRVQAGVIEPHTKLPAATGAYLFELEVIQALVEDAS